MQQEYTRIDGEWLQLHYRTSAALVVFAFLVELIMGLFLINSDLMRTTLYRYCIKYLLLPGGVNFALLALTALIFHSNRFSQEAKVYAVSLIFVCISFVVYGVHNIFISSYYISAIAIMLTVIYANYRVTGVVAVSSILSILVSELFISWDADKPNLFENTRRFIDFLVCILVLVSFSAVCMVVIRIERKKNHAGVQKEIERQQLQQCIHMDEMTGIYNLKAFRSALELLEEAQASGTEIPHVLAVVDIDWFKDINDTWGHHAGDLCLVAFANILKNCPENITPFRYGGDEFCLLFRDMNVAQAEAACRSIQEETQALCFGSYPELTLSVSFGLAAFSHQMDAVQLFIRADRALYEAKRDRNTIHIFQ